MYTEKRIGIKINDLIRERDISLRELGRLADIDISALSTLSRGHRKRIDLGHLQRIAEALDINDMNELLVIVNVEEEQKN
ncbi:helix-turn-helix domain-containing protein [Amphibacillus sp. Q70]|uniref:helix-turn-helix domain-containing protein n=1 Tax=Amphibacillus sp. Q70 TaxID=3453416 RepID=UPI003F86151F